MTTNSSNDDDNTLRHCGNCGQTIGHDDKFYIVPVYSLDLSDTQVKLEAICNPCYEYFTDKGKRR